MLKISITTVLKGFFILGKIHIGPVMVLGYFSFRFKSWEGFIPSDSLLASEVSVLFGSGRDRSAEKCIKDQYLKM